MTKKNGSEERDEETFGNTYNKDFRTKVAENVVRKPVRVHRGRLRNQVCVELVVREPCSFSTCQYRASTRPSTHSRWATTQIPRMR